MQIVAVLADTGYRVALSLQAGDPIGEMLQRWEAHLCLISHPQHLRAENQVAIIAPQDYQDALPKFPHDGNFKSVPFISCGWAAPLVSRNHP